MLTLSGRVLNEVSDPMLDFVGHIGGDDFVVLFGSTDWESRCHLALGLFEAGIRHFFHAADVLRGGWQTENRRGETEFQALTGMSIGAVEAEPGLYDNRHELIKVATEAKKKAKSLPGNTLYINQRRMP